VRKLYCVLIGVPLGTVCRDCCFVFRDYVGENSRFMTTRSDHADSPSWNLRADLDVSLFFFSLWWSSPCKAAKNRRVIRLYARLWAADPAAWFFPAGLQSWFNAAFNGSLITTFWEVTIRGLDVSRDCKHALSRSSLRLLIVQDDYVEDVLSSFCKSLFASELLFLDFRLKILILGRVCPQITIFTKEKCLYVLHFSI